MKQVFKHRTKQRRSEPQTAEESTVNYSHWTEVSDAAQDSADAIQAELDAYAASKHRRF